MSVPCGASVAEAQRDSGTKTGSSDMENAREYLKQRLLAGRTVGRCDLRDLIDSDLSGNRADFAMSEVIDVLLAERGDHGAKADTYVSGVIERYLESKEDLVAETAAELAEEVPGV